MNTDPAHGRNPAAARSTPGQPPSATRPRRFAELVLTGLAADPDELLGDLAEGAAGVAAARGARAARSWWWGQAARATPRLVWHGLRRRPGAVLAGVGVFIAFVVLSDLIPVPFGTNTQAYHGDSPVPPTTNRVLWDTAVTGLAMLALGALAGAATAALARRARLVPVVLLAVLLGLTYSRYAFYIVYGPARLVHSDGGTHWELELGTWSNDVVVPVLWQLPTMGLLLPLATMLGGLAVVSLRRRRQTERAGGA